MKKPMFAFLLLTNLAACSSFAQPTAVDVPTLAPTAMPILSTSAAPIGNGLLQTPTSEGGSALIPEHQPAAEWKGIPIMPGALTGEGDEEGYVFTIKATPQQIREYYELELGKLGWQPFSQGEEDSSMLTFMNDRSETLTINIISKGEDALVLLVR